MYWVVPRLVPPWVKLTPGLKMGEAMMLLTTVLPLLSTWFFASKVRLPFVEPYTILIGMM